MSTTGPSKATTDAGITLEGRAWTISRHPWMGRCPDCQGPAVFRETEPGRITGACCAPAILCYLLWSGMSRSYLSIRRITWHSAYGLRDLTSRSHFGS